MGNARALVAICPHRPDALFGQPLLGHVGWGYEYPNGEWCIGAIEGDAWRGDLNGFWAVKTPNLQSALSYFSTMKNHGAEYDYYKLLTVTNGVPPNPRYADQITNWVAKQPYNLFGRNCMNSTYDILYAFSGGKYNNSDLPHPGLNWIPNGWFNAIQTNEYYRLPASGWARTNSDNNTISKFKLGGEIKNPAWREEGEELFIINRSDEKNIETITVKAPEKEISL